MRGAPRVPVIFVNPEPDNEAAFDRPVEERAEQVEKWAGPEERRKSLRNSGIG